MSKLSSRRKQLLGEFVRTARARVTPQMAGLGAGLRRRTPGLRREEVALLCDISVTWYTWIEQGRDVSVSAQVWSRLADVLHLNQVERAYLFELADVIDPDTTKAQHGSLPTNLQACVDGIQGPAYILDKSWNMLYFNQSMDSLFNHWLSRTEQPNLLRFIFEEPSAKNIVVNWENRAMRTVSEFVQMWRQVLIKWILAALLRNSANRVSSLSIGGNGRPYWHEKVGFESFSIHKQGIKNMSS